MVAEAQNSLNEEREAHGIVDAELWHDASLRSGGVGLTPTNNAWVRSRGVASLVNPLRLAPHKNDVPDAVDDVADVAE